jgi:hypothetical protein
LRRIDGSAPNYQLSHYPLAYNNANKIARGDPVLLNASGQIDILAPGTTAIFGIFWGCKFPNPFDSGPPWHPAWLAPSGLNPAAVPVAQIIDDLGMIFEVQSNVASAAVTQASVGSNAQFAGQGAPSTNGQSTAYISAVANTATHPFRIVGLGRNVGNDNTWQFNTIEVVFNFAQRAVTTGV